MRTLSIQVGNRRAGVAIIYAVFGSFVAASLVAVMFTLAGVSNTRAETRRQRQEAHYLAEGAVEVAKKEVLQAIANWTSPPTEGQIAIGGRTATYTIEPTGVERIVTDPAGIQTIEMGYEIEALAIAEGMQERAHRVIIAESTPIFQFAVFYSNDLEILPGPNMNLGGRVHSNGDMYLGCGNTLTVDTNYLHALGDIYRRRKDADVSSGTVSVRKFVANPFDPMEPAEYVTMNSQSQMDPIVTTSGYDSSFDGWDADGNGDYTDLGDWLPFVAGALDFWSEPGGYGTPGHTVLTGEHGVTELVTPSIGSIKMYDAVEGGSYAFDAMSKEYVLVGPGLGTHDKGYFHQNAGLSIIVSENGSSWSAYDAMGNELPGFDLGGAISIGTIFDARQGGDVPLLEIDLALLKDTASWPANGLLYTAHYGMGVGTDAKGVQLSNGAELASSLTVISEGSAYVQGDFNTEEQKSAAVMADAVNLLSNAWDDSKVAGTLPLAEDTTFNCAIVTGNYETEGSVYNGGLENLPRFHESWSGKDCNITGSFVNAWESEYATGDWVYGDDRYKAPIRNWAYDTRFNSVANLPPYTPMVVSVSNVVSW